MIEGKVYALRMEIRTLAAQRLIQGRKYVVTIAKEGADKKIGPFQVTKKGQLTIGQKVQFKIPGSELRRESKCMIDVVEIQGKKQSEPLGKFEFLIMNYKNYSKNAFKLLDEQRTVGIINMSINISSPQSLKNNERFENKPNQKQPKRQQKKVRINESQVQAPHPLQSSLQIPPSINIKAPIEEIKLVCPSEAPPRQPKSMFSAFDNSSIVILTKKEVEAEPRRRSQTMPLSSMGELFQKKKEIFAKQESVLKLPNENLIKSCRLSPSRLHKDSRYCKEIQQNLDNFSALDQQSNRLSCSRSPLKGQQDFSIFDTLHRMKDKFQKIHEQEGFLNDQPLDELTEVNQEQTEQKEKLVQSQNSKYYPIENLSKKIKSEYEPLMQLGKSTIINLEVHSAVSHLAQSQQYGLFRNRIIRTVDLYCPPARPPLRITACPSLQLSLNPSYQLIPVLQAPTNKRYRLAMTSNASAFQPREEIEELKQPPTLSQSYLNFQIQEQSLQRYAYIKLNKISHLSRAADISKRRNNFLIKANEELKVAKRLAEQKLDVSKKIIGEKQELLTHQFDALREHMRIISANLSLKNEQSLKREQKVKSLQAMVQQNVRDINSLKEDLKAKHATIKNLKALLSIKEESEPKVKTRQDPVGNNRSLRGAMLQQLGISKNIFEMLMEGGRQNELSISKNLKEPVISSKKEDPSRRGGDLLAEIQQSQPRIDSFNKTFIQERKVRKYSSIQTVNNIQQPGADKSADLSSRTFRKFSHSKNGSACVPEPQKKGGKANTNIDVVFEKLAGLFGGDSNGRVLKNL